MLGFLDFGATAAAALTTTDREPFIDGMPYYIAVTAALNAAANAGAFLSHHNAAYRRDPVVVDRDSYALAVTVVARFLDVDDE